MTYQLEYFNLNAQMLIEAWLDGLKARYLALLIRMPVDKRSIAVSYARPVMPKEICAANALMFVLIDVDMDFLLQGFLRSYKKSNLKSCYLMIRYL
jgi:hypothetical protein